LEWIRCEDQLPKAGIRVLFCIEFEDNYGFVGEGFINRGGVWHRYVNFPISLMFDDNEVTKWMYLPKV